MKIHCLYRDFFLFLKMMNLEKDRWGSFKRLYYEKHRDFLSRVWIEYQDFSVKDIRNFVLSIKKKNYENIENLLKVYDIEENTKEIILRCKDLLHYPDICNIYLFIGFEGPATFILRYRKTPVICVVIERALERDVGRGIGQFASFRFFPVLLGHRFCHYTQRIRKGESDGTVLGSLIREGLAVYFARQAYPDYDDHVYSFLSKDAYSYLEGHFEEVYEKALRGGNDFDVFSFGADSSCHAASYIGYRILSDYIRNTGEERVEKLIESEDLIRETAGVLLH